MKIPAFLLKGLSLAALALPSPLVQGQALRIMPVGDSITEGAGGTAGIGGYRGFLYNLLVNAGHSIDFVGSHQTNSALLTDRDHDGWGGWTIGQIDANIAGWLNGIGAAPDILLLHIGTNNFGNGASNPGAINELDALITKIAGLRPSTHIIVTNLMERGGTANTNIVNEFNPFVQGIVNNHITAGDSVSFLDMRAAVPLSDMPDQLHPNDTGYGKMAAAYFGAIEDVLEPADNVPPVLVSAMGAESLHAVTVVFNRKLDLASAQNAGNYALDGGLGVFSAVLSQNGRRVTLTTSPQTAGTTYTLTVNNVKDLVSPTPNTIAANSTIPFYGATAPGYRNHVPESDCYTLLYSLDVPAGANYGAGTITYNLDNRNRLGSYDRIAYYLELQKPGEDLQYAWASMDAFSSDLAKIGVPVTGTGMTFQQLVTNLNVVSNVAGVVEGDAQNGNIEFWPSNYSEPNSLPVPGANAGTFDFGDTPTAGNYGSMQVHNTDAAQTVMAFNSWGGDGGIVDLGIGNSPAGSPDWTFAQNGPDYTVRKLQVLVRTLGDLTPPTLASAEALLGAGGIKVRFSEPVRPETLVAANFSINNGVAVLGVSFGDDLHEVTLATTTQPDGAPLTLTVSNVRDTSPNANVIPPASTIAVSPAAPLPAEVVANIGAPSNGYQLVYSVNIPATGNFNAVSPYATNNSSTTGPFSRVAYYLELQVGAGPVEYVWASMDAFTPNVNRIGIPTVASGAFFQQTVSNLDVVSSAGSNVTPGTGLATGNIEFWPSNYSGPNTAAVPNATAAFDFGDGGAGTGAGYGSMQIHNHGVSQTIFALNRWGVDGNPLCLGMGNRPGTVDTDWTFADNAATYSRRVLHIMVLPTPPAPVPAEVLANVPESSGYKLVYSLNVPGTGNLAGGAGFASYDVDQSNLTTPFSRVAYYLELQKTGDAQPTFVWVSMDAFTNERKKIGVPSVASGSVWQRLVSNLNVVSNSPNVTGGTGLSGNLEFWPGNYNGTNDLPVPGATAAFDFGDGGKSTTFGHGSMQVHNYVAGQTLFAINRWGTNANTTNALAIGIGNNQTLTNNDPDYTFTYNAPSFNLRRRLHVLVLPGASPVGGPAIAKIIPSTTLGRLVVSFDRAVSDGSATPGNFTLDGGVTVTGATLLSGNREIALTTSAQTAGAAYNLSVTGVRERAQSGAVIQPGSIAAFTAYSPPAALANIPPAETGYELIYRLAIPAVTPQWNLNPVTYGVDEAKYGERLFDRVAYLMELDGNWVYASFDPHTNRIAKIGVPTLQVSATPFQQRVTNMNVASNVGSIVTGPGITTGNIEFWGGNYAGANGAGIPGASDTLFDFGDSMSVGGHGSMQIHNYGAAQTLFGYNNWGNNTGGTSDLGIGNDPAPVNNGLDWTFHANASTYTTRNLYVLARSGGGASGPRPEILTPPCDRSANPGEDVTFAVTPVGTGPFTYQWRLNGVAINGETRSWLSLANVSGGNAGTYDVVVTGSNLASTVSSAGILNVIGSNIDPTFSGFAFAVQRDGSAAIPLAILLANANDTDGGSPVVTAVNSPSVENGTVTLNAGDITYMPEAGFLGSDSFTITVGDGQGGSVVGTVNVSVTFQAIEPKGGNSLAFQLPGGRIEVIFYATPGVEYAFQRSLNLVGWMTLETGIAGDDGIVVFIDPAPPVGARAFYRTLTPVIP